MTATIEILNNVRCRLTAPVVRMREVDDALAMPIEGAFFAGRGKRSRGWWDDGRKHFLYRSDAKSEVGTCPKGLMSRVEQLFAEVEEPLDIKDLRKTVLPAANLSRLSPTMLKGTTPAGEAIVMAGKYAYQLRAARDALKAGSGILWMATNAGKTEVAAAMISVLNEAVTLFVVPKKKLLHDTRRRIAARLGTIPEEIGVIGDGRFEPKEITVAIINSITPKRTTKKTSKKAKQRQAVLKRYLKMVQLVFLDEGHHARSTTWFKLIQSMVNAQYRYILSGTPFGSGNALMVEAAVGPVVARVSNAELVALGVSARPEVHLYEVREPEIDSSDWHTVYTEGIVHNAHRNSILANVTARLSREGKRTLILVRELAHGDKLRQLLRVRGIEADFVHGEMATPWVDNSVAQFEDTEGGVLIASPIFDEGVDIPLIQALVLADGGKSVRAVLQKVGRSLRKKTGHNTVTVVDCTDFTHKWLSEHSLQRIEIYEGEEFEVVHRTPDEEKEGTHVERAGAAPTGSKVVQALPRQDVLAGVPRCSRQAAHVRGSSRAGLLPGSGDRLCWHRRASA